MRACPCVCVVFGDEDFVVTLFESFTPKRQTRCSGDSQNKATRPDRPIKTSADALDPQLDLNSEPSTSADHLNFLTDHVDRTRGDPMPGDLDSVENKAQIWFNLTQFCGLMRPTSCDLDLIRDGLSAGDASSFPRKRLY